MERSQNQYSQIGEQNGEHFGPISPPSEPYCQLEGLSKIIFPIRLYLNNDGGREGIKQKAHLETKWALTLKLAVRTGLEPATPCVTGMYSNQLNYRTFLTYQESANVATFLNPHNPNG